MFLKTFCVSNFLHLNKERNNNEFWKNYFSFDEVEAVKVEFSLVLELLFIRYDLSGKTLKLSYFGKKFEADCCRITN